MLSEKQHSCAVWHTAGNIFRVAQSIQMCAESGLIFLWTCVRQQDPKPRESKSTVVTALPLYLKSTKWNKQTAPLEIERTRD